MRKLTLLLATFFAATLYAQQTATRLLREPAIGGGRIAFVYGGDLWLVDASGGEARRLTSDDGLELFPHFSPDGRQLAFTGEYSGTKQVFVIDVDGGAPRQLTFYNDVGPLPPRGGVDNRVVDWSPDGKLILFNPHRLPWNDRMPRHYVVPAAGGMETPLAIPEGSAGMFSPDGTRVVYTPIERESRTWKRYRGGRAQDVWIYDLEHNTSEQITTNPSTDNQPLWVGNTIFFTSDRPAEGGQLPGKLNLYAYDLGTKQTRRVTNHTDYDVLWPSSDRKQIVYECGGYVWKYDPATGSDTRVPIHVVGDFKGTVPYFKNVKGNIQNFAISPSGARVLMEARGDVFSVPAKYGEIRDVTQTPGIRERDPSWSPDGRSIAYLSDRSGGEYEIYVRAADGSGTERQLTSHSGSWPYAPLWSPDSKKLAWSDKTHTLHLLDVASGKISDVDHDDYGDLTHYRWSPDSRWVVYTKLNDARFSSIFVYSLGDAKAYRLTSGMTDDTEPVFDPKGRYLYFTSNRDFNMTFSAFEFNYVYTDPTRVYVGLLAQDGPAILLPRSDEEVASTDKGHPPAGENDAAASKAAKPAATKPDGDAADATLRKSPSPANVRIDVAGFERRVRAIPAAAGSYGSLAAVGNGVLYLSGPGDKAALRLYNLDERKEETVLENVQAYDISANGEKVAAQTAGAYVVVPAKGGQKVSSDDTLALDHLEMKIDPRAEWTEEFNDAWRILRDWFYDPNMHGVDWNATRERYGQLVPFIAHRSDLDYIFGEMSSELSAGHIYTESSDDWQVHRVNNGLLGAEIVADSGFFRVAHVFPGENWHESFRSPLTEPGVKVNEGDYILAVDGTTTRGVDNFYRLLENKAGRVVTLLVSAKADGTGAHEEKVRPTAKETNLRYLEWVQSRRAMVDRLSGGRIGYLHLPNTGGEGNRELFKYFYPQVGKEALIIDDRYNGGGFIPDRMIELLDRPILNYWVRRGEKPSQTPAYANDGPKVMLINGYSSSGGDALPYYFRKRGMGTLIGTRTWGGLIGLSGNPGLMDGGSISAPQFRFLDTSGIWAVEGQGVSPDIEVVDRPELVVAGHDPSLEKGIQVLLDQLAKNPPKKLVLPVPPVIP